MPENGFSVVFVPDTQEYSDYGGNDLNYMMNWIVDNQATYNIQAVIGLGDIVSHPTDATEWAAAKAAYNLIDAANIPCFVGMGNHDFDTLDDTTRATTIYNTHFPQATYTGKDWWNGGFFEEGKAENSYFILAIGGADYLFLNLEYGPRQAVVDWANALLTTHADKTAILSTHAYMYHDDTRLGAGDDYNPKGDYADAHDGEDLWTELVSPHDNIPLVLSGHVITADGSAYRVDNSVGGQPVHQMLADYQVTAINQNGYLRVVMFDPTNQVMHAYTYSPTQQITKTSNKNQLTGLEY